MTETNPKRRWFRFSLRALLVFMTVLCVWIGLKVNAARRQHEAVGAVLTAGGTVAFDYQVVPAPPGMPAGDINLNLAPRTPLWMRNLLGEDLFRNVATCTIRRKSVTASALAQIGRMPDLIAVGLEDVKIVNSLSDTKRTVQDADLIVLGQLCRLEVVCINEAGIEGSGLGNLAAAKDHLKILFLSRNPINDAGVEQIGQLKALVWLILTDTSITDAGLQHLKGLQRLTAIDLSGTRVTAEGIRELQRSLPNAKITGP